MDQTDATHSHDDTTQKGVVLDLDGLFQYYICILRDMDE